MSRYVFLLVVLSVLLSSFAQIVLKAGMSNAGVLMALQNGSNLVVFRAISTNLYVIGGLGLYFASAAVWLLVLARIDVSLAYPMVGLGFVVTMLLAWMIHDEALTLTKVAGTLLIAAGVYVMAKG